MLRAEIHPYLLEFAFRARTSREVFTEKRTFFIKVFDSENPGVAGTGEIAVFPSLAPSFAGWPEFGRELADFAARIDEFVNGAELPLNSAIRFGFETAMADYANGGNGLLFPSAVLENIWRGIPINGLIWMNDAATMSRQVEDKIKAGFRCLKLKIGSLDFETELGIIQGIRSRFDAKELTLRLDANGAFTPENVFERLERLSRYDIHSIEQPLKRGSAMLSEVCKASPVPIALDEELIERWWSTAEIEAFLEKTRPSYLVIKPSLIGGFAEADKWIETAEKLNVGWWATSALESNVGLSAIAQWLATHPRNLNRPHGLGTGQIYTNNVQSNIQLIGQRLFLTERPLGDKSENRL